MSLQETTEVILYDPERTAAWLELADRYINQYEQDPARFVLPKAYTVLRPIIEAYAGNLLGFKKYVRLLRNEFPAKSLAYKSIQAVYRTLEVRHTQQQRRKRAAIAIAKAVELYGAAPFQTRQVWIAKLEHIWSKRRNELLARHKGKINNDEKAELLDEFWETLKHEIERGERIPPWHQ